MDRLCNEYIIHSLGYNELNTFIHSLDNEIIHYTFIR